MSIVSKMLKTGAAVLKTLHGEPLSLRGFDMVGIVTRDPSESWSNGEKKDKPSFLPKGLTSIEVMNDALSVLPTALSVGDVFTTLEDGVSHRVQEIRPNEYVTICLCKTSS